MWQYIVHVLFKMVKNTFLWDNQETTAELIVQQWKQ